MLRVYQFRHARIVFLLAVTEVHIQEKSVAALYYLIRLRASDVINGALFALTRFGAIATHYLEHLGQCTVRNQLAAINLVAEEPGFGPGCQSVLNIDPVLASKSDQLLGVIGRAPGGDARSRSA